MLLLPDEEFSRWMQAVSKAARFYWATDGEARSQCLSEAPACCAYLSVRVQNREMNCLWCCVELRLFRYRLYRLMQICAAHGVTLPQPHLARFDRAPVLDLRHASTKGALSLTKASQPFSNAQRSQKRPWTVAAHTLSALLRGQNAAIAAGET